MMLNEFTARLHAIRRGRGISQAKLDDLADFSKNTTNNWERGLYTTPKACSVIKYAMALEVDPQELTGDLPLPEFAVPFYEAPPEAAPPPVDPMPEPTALPPQAKKKARIQQNIFLDCYAGSAVVKHKKYAVAANLRATQDYDRELRSRRWDKVLLTVEGVLCST